MRDSLLKREQRRRQGVWQKETNFLERENTAGGLLTLEFIGPPYHSLHLK